MSSPGFVVNCVGLSYGIRPRGSTHIHSLSARTHSKSLYSTPSTSLQPVSPSSPQFSFFGTCQLLGEKPRQVLTLFGGTVLVWAVSSCLLLLWGAWPLGLLLAVRRARAVLLVPLLRSR